MAWTISVFKLMQKMFVTEVMEHEKALSTRPNIFWHVLLFFEKVQVFFIPVEKRFVLVFAKFGFVLLQFVEQLFLKAIGPVVTRGDSVVDPCEHGIIHVLEFPLGTLVVIWQQSRMWGII